MKYLIEIPVDSSLEIIKQSFNRELFTALKPPFVSLRILRYDGNSEGNEIHLQIKSMFLVQNWVSVISREWKNDHEWGFEDVGKVLPFFLKSWKHKHIVRKSEKGSVIVEDVWYEPKQKWMSVFVRFFVYLQFKPRPRVYRRWFNNFAHD